MAASVDSSRSRGAATASAAADLIVALSRLPWCLLQRSLGERQGAGFHWSLVTNPGSGMVLREQAFAVRGPDERSARSDPLRWSVPMPLRPAARVLPRRGPDLRRPCSLRGGGWKMCRGSGALLAAGQAARPGPPELGCGPGAPRYGLPGGWQPPDCGRRTLSRAPVGIVVGAPNRANATPTPTPAITNPTIRPMTNRRECFFGVDPSSGGWPGASPSPGVGPSTICSAGDGPISGTG